MTTTTLLCIDGMTCGGCTASVERALRQVQGVSHASVDLKQARAEVIHDEAQATAQQLVQAVDDAGFEARVSGGAAG